LVLLAVSFASAQWIEKTLYLPDSFGGALRLENMVHDPANNCVYVAGGNCVIVVDGATDRKLARIPIPANAAYLEHQAICCNPIDNKIYCAGWLGPYKERRTSLMVDSIGWVSIIDASTNSVTCTIKTEDWPRTFCFNSTNDKVYCGVCPRSLIVIDGVGDSVLRNVAVGDLPLATCYSPEHNKVYYLSAGSEMVIDGEEDSVIATHALFCDMCANSICYNPCNNHVYVPNLGGPWLEVLDGSTNALLKRIFHDYLELCGTLCDTMDNKIYCAPWDPPVFVIDGAADSVVAEIDASPDADYAVNPLCYNSVRSRIYCANKDNTVIVIDGWTNSVLDTFAGTIPLCYNPTNNKAYCGSANGVAVVNGNTNSITKTVPIVACPDALCYDRADNKVYCANSVCDNLTVLDGAANRDMGTVPVGHNPGVMCYNSENHKIYCVSGADGSVTVISGATDSVTASVAVGTKPCALCYNPVNNRAYCANSGSKSVSVIDGLTDSVVATVDLVMFAPVGLCCDSTSNKIYCACGNSAVCVIDGATNRFMYEIQTGHSSQAVCYNPLDNKIYSANWDGDNSGTVTVINGATDSIVRTVRVANGSPTMCFNPRRDRLYCANYGGFGSDTVVVIGGANNQVLRRIPIGDGPISLCYNAMNDKVYCANLYSNDVPVIDCASDLIVESLPAPGGPCALAWNPVQNRVYVANGSASCVSVLRDSLVVGLEDLGIPVASQPAQAPTVVRGILKLPGRPSVARARLLDISGRTVLDLRPGANDVRALAPGVYFVRGEGRGTGDEGCIRKVVVTR